MSDKVVGSVLVVGGGIAGMQAALDLADSGYLVHVVEKSSAIGGVMSELGQAVPAKGGGLWIISPEMGASGPHLNINLLTSAGGGKIIGVPGNF